ncbi:hypothetical protein KI387_035563, partial [Taxus chinensis]
ISLLLAISGVCSLIGADRYSVDADFSEWRQFYLGQHRLQIEAQNSVLVRQLDGKIDSDLDKENERVSSIKSEHYLSSESESCPNQSLRGVPLLCSCHIDIVSLHRSLGDSVPASSTGGVLSVSLRHLQIQRRSMI